MKTGKEVLEVIQDHANITQFIDQVCCYLENDDLQKPNYIPVLHDVLVTDQLGVILRHIVKDRHE